MLPTGSYESIGGVEGCRALAEALYEGIAGDPLLRPLFPGKTFNCAIQEFTAFLVQFLNGPAEKAQHRWRVSLQESHRRFPIGKRERSAWLKHMFHALEEVPLDDATRAAFRGFFEHASAYLVNQDPPPPTREPLPPELERAWSTQRAVDETVAAICAGEADRAVALAGALELHPTVYAGLIARMVQQGGATLLEYAHQEIQRSPALVHARYNGWTLLHVAAGAGSLATVVLLLAAGADPNARDGGGHTPLYSLANQCQVPGGAKIVAVLLNAGASVDACEGVKRCTPLHMAARRGNVEIAAALLDAGADIEARDSTGDTPLRRAVNCSKPEVAALLVARGANVRSRGSKSRTPLEAARTPDMLRALRPA
jgi:truncated hemoglobin YjbI